MPSDTPSDTPTDAPSDAPTDAPSEAPKTLPEMTEATATAADTIVATFASDVPADTAITVTKADGTSVESSKTTIEGTKATFVSKTKFPVGKYTITAKLGEATTSKEVTVEKEVVTEIKVTSTQALLKAGDKKTAIVYYDVYSQYGTSMRSSTSITWTASSGTVKADKSTGRLEIKKEGDEFTYGQKLYVVGVDAKSGKTVQAELPIGLEQAVDSVEFAGFLNTKADLPKSANDLSKGLPAKFPSNTYVMLYTAKDQDGQMMPAEKRIDAAVSGAALTVTADNPLVVKSNELKDGEIYTIDGTEYSSITMQPGDYADKGGEVNLLVISNKTGKQTKINFTVGVAAMLKSFTLNIPDKTVADGDTDIEIPYEALDVDGNSIKNYETIVRSQTNTLKLNAADGTTLKLEEKADGTAVLKWSDSNVYSDSYPWGAVEADSSDKDLGIGGYGYHLMPGYRKSDSFDGQDRMIFLSAMVINGENSNIMLPVSDMRRPTTISKVKLNDDDAGALVAGNSAKINIASNQVTYVDQYGEKLDDWKAEDFFQKSANNLLPDGRKYAVKVTPSVNSNAVVGGVYGETKSDLKINFTTVANQSSITTETMKYSVVEKDKGEWNETGKALSASYKIVPVTELSSLSVKAISKQHLDTVMSQYANAADLAQKLGITTGSAIEETVAGNGINNGSKVEVTGISGGKTLTIPESYYTIDQANFVVSGGSIVNIADGAFKWYDLYDANSAKNTRIDATKPLKVDVYKTTAKTDLKGSPDIDIKVSDALSVPTEICFVQNYSGKQTSGTVKPEKLNVDKFSSATGLYSSGDLAVVVYDQYGKIYVTEKQKKEMMKELTRPYEVTYASDASGNLSSVTGCYKTTPMTEADFNANFIIDSDLKFKFNVTDIKENEDEFAHVLHSFKVDQNNSANAQITGAEIKDTFKLTATATANGMSTTISIPVTVDADKKAYLGTNENVGDKELRDEFDRLNQ